MTSTIELIEVSRDTESLSTELSYFYVHVKPKNVIGCYPDTKYYATNEELTFVGKFIERRQTGRGDGATILIEFDLETVELNYEGTTCFLSIDLPDGARIEGSQIVFDK